MKPQCQKVRRFYELDSLWESTAMIRAMVECLDLRQKCHMLLEEFDQASLLRDALLRKICEDENAKSDSILEQTVARLLEFLQVRRGKESQAAGYCVSQLSSVCSKAVCERVIRGLISCKYISNRRRGYRLARTAMSKSLLIQVKRNWEQHYDSEAARIVIDHCDTSYVADQKQKLIECFVDAPWNMAKLYISLAKISIAHLQDLRKSDGITYAYVITKLGRRLRRREAMEIFETNMGSERIGLLIWCFGKQRLWSVLTSLCTEWSSYETRYQELRGQRIAALIEPLTPRTSA